MTSQSFRFCLFHALEVQEELAPGEWVRNDAQSTRSLEEQINSYLAQTSARPYVMSAPQVSRVAVTSDGRRRTFGFWQSVFFQLTEEIVDDGQESSQESQPENPATAPRPRVSFGDQELPRGVALENVVQQFGEQLGVRLAIVGRQGDAPTPAAPDDLQQRRPTVGRGIPRPPHAP